MNVEINILIMLIVVCILTILIFYLLLKKGFDFNRTGRNITLISTIITAMLLVYLISGKIIIYIIAFFISVFATFYLWPAYYELYLASEPLREKWRKKGKQINHERMFQAKRR